LSGQQPNDIPHIIARVFNFKLRSLLKHDILEKKIFGKVKAYVYVIEFQKRGLPHAHILLILEDENKITTVDHIDECISAELPDPNVDPTLFQIKQNMIHTCSPQRCGPMSNGKCKKRFPRDLADQTVWNEDGYPIYQRRNNGRTATVGPPNAQRIVDNRSVVPYNPYLSKRYKAHINVEVCSFVDYVN
jgi:ATP-dependent DNA helicase PIF1